MESNHSTSSHSSQSRSNVWPCLVCKKKGCHLRTHRLFAERVLKTKHEESVRPLVNEIHNEKPDPFADPPVRMNRYRENIHAQFYRKWNTDFNGPERHLYPFSRFRAIQAAASTDTGAFLALMSLVATQQSLIRFGRVDEDAVDLQNEVLLAQQRLVPRDGPSDARLMTALVILSNAIALNGTVPLTSHLDTIKGFLRARGGLTYLGMQGLLTDNLLYADHTKAVIHDKLPEYPLSTTVLFCTTAPRSSPRFTQLRDANFISDEVCTACSSMCILIKIYDRAAKGTVTASENTYFEYLSTITENQLARANANYCKESSLDRCFTLAHLLLNHVLLRNYGSVQVAAKYLEARLWACFETLRNQRFFEIYGFWDLEYYFTCVGCMVSLRRPTDSRQKSIELIRELQKEESKRVLGVKRFHDLCNIMEEYGWSESVCITAYARIWNEVVENGSMTPPPSSYYRSAVSMQAFTS